MAYDLSVEGDVGREPAQGVAPVGAARRWRRRPDPLSDPGPLIRRVYTYVAYRVGAGADAEDLTSEVFERALRYRRTFDPSKGDNAAWLMGIARRVVADHRSAQGVVQPTDHPPDVESPLNVEAQSVLRLSLEQALAALPERDRELISLRYGADLKARQIAVVMEMETHAVEVALSRALERLRSQIGDEHHFDL